MIRIDINTGNEAFKPHALPEVIRILSELTSKFAATNEVGAQLLSDFNGNTVGSVTLHTRDSSEGGI